MQIQRSSIYFVRIIADIGIILFCFWGSFSITGLAIKLYFSLNEIYLFLSLILIWGFSSKNLGIYDEFRSRNFSFELISIFKAIAAQAIGVVVVIFFIKKLDASRTFVLYYILSLTVFLAIEKYTIRQILNLLRKKGRNLRNVLIIGAGKVGRSFYNTLENNPHFGYRLIGFLDDKMKPSLNGEYIGKISDLDKILGTREVNNVIIALPNFATERIEEVVRVCGKHTTRVKIIPDYFKIVSNKYSVSMFGPFPMVSVREDKVDDYHWRLIKRVVDITFSLLLFMFVFPWLWAIIAALIKVASPGPVFFKQERWGRNNKKFYAYKFRSMKVNCRDLDSNGKFNQAKPNDPRVTKIGRFLRRSNLDELPQFWNVLKGEMSIVGPRPHPTPLNLESKDSVKYYMIRHLVKPGITGWAQVNGCRGETTNTAEMQKRIDRDIWYIENWTFWLDLQIIILTAWKMLKGDPNAY